MIKVKQFFQVVGVVALLALCSKIATAQQPQSVAAGLLIRTSAPANNTTTPFPSNSGFFRVDLGTLSQASKFSPPISRIVGFPLGSRLVNLNVSQFDAITRDAKIFATTSDGEIPLHLPEYVLLRGEVEGTTNSHVYLAVFPDMVLGYVEIKNSDGSSTRYIVQPIESGESRTTMICYQENAIDRTNDKSAKWKCGTEELAKNFNRLDAIAQDIVTPIPQSGQPSVQAKSVRVMNVDIDCDQRYYQDFKGDTTKALSYALATLAASSDIYVRDLNAALVAQYLHLWITPDPYISPDTSIDAMLNSWQSANGLPSDNRAGGIMLSGWPGIGGLAYLGTVCSESGGTQDLGYCVCGTDNIYTYPHDGWVWDVDVVSHEFGHVVGSPHTHSCFWAPAIDSCYPAEGNCFTGTKPTLGTIMSYCHLTNAGVELKFHKRQLSKMQQWIQQASCAHVEQLPQANAGGDVFVCGVDSAVVTGSGTSGTEPYTYSWRVIKANTIVSTAPTFKVKPFATTTYVLTLTDANNLRTYDTMTVRIGTLKAIVDGNLTVCGSGPLVLQGTATGGAGVSKKNYLFEWTDKSDGSVVGTDSLITVPITVTKTYTFKVTDSVGCTSSTDLIVTVAPKPVCTISSGNGTTFCENDSVQIDAGSGFKSYRWLKDGNPVSVITQKYWVKTAGDYSCIVANTGQGCLDTSNVLTFIQTAAPAKPTISQVGNDLLCPTSSEIVGYQWYKNNVIIPGATDSMYNAKGNGQFYVVVSNSTGCKSKSNVLAVTLAVEDHATDRHVSLYPNPATSEIVLEWKDIIGTSKLQLRITDASGKTVYFSKPIPTSASSTFAIDVHSLAAGTYMLHYDFGYGEALKKFVKE